MKGFIKFVALLFVAVAFVMSCSKDDSGSITFDVPAIFLSDAGATATVGFTLKNVAVGTLSISSKPKGWEEPTFDTANRQMTVVAPSREDIDNGDAVDLGSIVVKGETPGGKIVSTTIFVSIVLTEDFSSRRANSYLVSNGNTNYTIDVSKNPYGSPLASENVKVMWQSRTSLVQYIDFQDGKATFYVGVDSDDDTKIKSGNALIGAYNANDELLWSWHIWAADFDADATALHYANGYVVMERNLGALNNANSTADERLASFGLFYQWGRKDPFIGPSSYRAPSGDSAAIYNGSNSRVYLTFAATDAKIGTQAYAAQNPMTYITGVSESGYDWLWVSLQTAMEDGSRDFWGATKTVNDPCPYGWKVATPAAFDGLSIADDLNAGYEPYYEKYGWTLTNGAVSSLYMAPGRRRYDNGKFLNVFNPPSDARSRSDAMEAQPWEGIYWTSEGGKAFYFWFNKQDVAASGVENRVLYYRANGLQVRCMKEYVDW